MSTAKPFHIGDVLSITTGRLVSPRHIGGVYEILNHMTGDNLFTHQLGRAAEACAPILLSDHPWLIEMGADLERRLDAVPEGGDMESAIRDALVSYGLQIGCSDINVLPLAPESWLRIDPLQELSAMVGEEKIMVVELPDASE